MVYSAGVPLNYRKIKKLRESLGMTQDAAAHKAKMKSRQHWNNVENGRGTVNIDLLERIAKALGVTASELLE